MSEPTLWLNQTSVACPPGLTLSDLLHREGLPSERVATAVNARHVPREARETTLLNPGDTVLTFEAIVGG
ncbi:MAG: sulfur carrier protein ThiS [Hydrogenophaga sp.]|uniref:sulfur carrier protein ThiS n=1 Tax=Hydrogenophaga sp. TaxID=1904254 RepID=UPI001D68A70F|nr:sulfur carrier protein ThiS [Hydrogenophaga sp.]MBX3608528.1 sulfur carrier protein ThiS [Hydrogenophaga sp.]